MADETFRANRRDFLKFAGVGAPAAAVAAVAAPKDAEAETRDEAGDGLRKTAHVKKYLDSARF